MKRTLIITGAILALASPALAQDKTTLDYVTTKGAVLTMQGEDLLFDAAHGNQTSIPFGSGGTLKVIAAGGELGISNGSLTVTEGAWDEASSHAALPVALR